MRTRRKDNKAEKGIKHGMKHLKHRSNDVVANKNLTAEWFQAEDDISDTVSEAVLFQKRSLYPQIIQIK